MCDLPWSLETDMRICPQRRMCGTCYPNRQVITLSARADYCHDTDVSDRVTPRGQRRRPQESRDGGSACVCDGSRTWRRTDTAPEWQSRVFEQRQERRRAGAVVGDGSRKAAWPQDRIHVRTATEWAAVVAGNPFPDEAKRDPGHLIVFAFKDTLAAAAVKALQAAITGREVVRASGRHAYVVYPDGAGKSRLTPALMDRKLGARGTGRNWNTVLKLAAITSS